MFRQALRSSTNATRRLQLLSRTVEPRSRMVSQQSMREKSTVSSVYTEKTHRREYMH